MSQSRCAQNEQRRRDQRQQDMLRHVHAEQEAFAQDVQWRRQREEYYDYAGAESRYLSRLGMFGKPVSLSQWADTVEVCAQKQRQARHRVPVGFPLEPERTRNLVQAMLLICSQKLPVHPYG